MYATLDNLYECVECIKILDLSYKCERMGSGVVYNGVRDIANYQLYY